MTKVVDGELIIETKEDLLYMMYEEESVEELREDPYKHDISIVSAVASFENRHWLFTFMRSYNDGIEDYFPIKGREAEQKEVVKKVWVLKNDNPQSA